MRRGRWRQQQFADLAGGGVAELAADGGGGSELVPGLPQ
jgi:hypothetical protein